MDIDLLERYLQLSITIANIGSEGNDKLANQYLDAIRSNAKQNILLCKFAIERGKANGQAEISNDNGANL